LILDVSDTDSITLVSHTYLNPQKATFCGPRVFKNDRTVFYTTGGHLYVYDVSNPYLPIEIASYNTGGNSCITDIVANQEYLFLGDGTKDRVEILSLNNDEISIVSTIDVGDVRGLFLTNSKLYIATGHGGGLLIYSLTDPQDPVFEGKFDTWGTGENVFVQDSIAFLANGSLKIIDVSNSQTPIELGSYDPPWFRIFNVVVHGDNAYVSNHGRFRILDVSEPTSPECLGEGSPGGYNFQILDSTLYVAQPKTYVEDVGVQIFNVSDPFNPSRIGSLITGANYNNIEIHDSMVYVVGWNFGIQSFPDDGTFDPHDIVTVNMHARYNLGSSLDTTACTTIIIS